MDKLEDDMNFFIQRSIQNIEKGKQTRAHIFILSSIDQDAVAASYVSERKFK